MVDANFNSILKINNAELSPYMKILARSVSYKDEEMLCDPENIRETYFPNELPPGGKSLLSVCTFKIGEGNEMGLFFSINNVTMYRYNSLIVFGTLKFTKLGSSRNQSIRKLRNEKHYVCYLRKFYRQRYNIQSYPKDLSSHRIVQHSSTRNQRW